MLQGIQSLPLISHHCLRDLKRLSGTYHHSQGPHISPVVERLCKIRPGKCMKMVKLSLSLHLVPQEDVNLPY